MVAAPPPSRRAPTLTAMTGGSIRTAWRPERPGTTAATAMVSRAITCLEMATVRSLEAAIHHRPLPPHRHQQHSLVAKVSWIIVLRTSFEVPPFQNDLQLNQI